MKEKKSIPDISWLLTISAPLSRERRGNLDRERRITIADRDIKTTCKEAVHNRQSYYNGGRRAGRQKEGRVVNNADTNSRSKTKNYTMTVDKVTNFLFSPPSRDTKIREDRSLTPSPPGFQFIS
jgi:hypothetical protein